MTAQPADRPPDEVVEPEPSPVARLSREAAALADDLDRHLTMLATARGQVTKLEQLVDETDDALRSTSSQLEEAVASALERAMRAIRS